MGYYESEFMQFVGPPIFRQAVPGYHIEPYLIMPGANYYFIAKQSNWNTMDHDNPEFKIPVSSFLLNWNM